MSGALGLALLEATESRGLGLSAFVSIGNKADVSSNDLLEWWEDDPQRRVLFTSSPSAIRDDSGRSPAVSRERSPSSR